MGSKKVGSVNYENDWLRQLEMLLVGERGDCGWEVEVMLH